jgi:molecular chaperone GrpE
MTDETKKNGVDESSEAKPEADTAVGPSEFATAARDASEAGADEAQEPSELELVTAERDALKDKYLRLAAEMDNLRRRTARDVRDAKAYSVSNFARDMLAVSDNLRRALDAIPAEALEAGEAGLKALSEGVEMTERAMLAALERHGVKKLSPAGQKFDPHFHQAMFEVQNPDVPNNTVVDVVQEGFVIGDRVLRPAMVGVAKGGPKQPSSDAETEDAQAEDAEG